LTQLGDIEGHLGDQLPFAFSQKLGYLTACPTNTGTGLRISVMLHLPGLARAGKIEELLQGIAPYGIAVRGFYGENSEFQGDFYQVSNEITLGKSEEDIQALLQRVIEQILEREERLRADLFETQRTATEDSFWRAWAILSHARLMSSEEALNHLSWLRIGIDLGLLPGVTHADLNRIVIEMQPAHLEIRHNDGGALEVANRDELRARLLRDHLTGAGGN
jgi:protein arginine kinase